MINNRLLLIFLIYIPLSYPIVGKKIKITNYKPILEKCDLQRTGIRSFLRNNVAMKLLVNNETLKTEMIKAKSIQCEPRNIFELKKDIAKSYYAKLLFVTSSTPYPRHNDGLLQFSSKIKGAVLSSDLCPTKRGLYKRFFEKTFKAFSNKKQPIPIVFAISGNWLRFHEKDFNYLLEQEKLNKIKITWANHSYTHPYPKRSRSKKQLEQFFLTYGKPLNKEIFGTEKLLIKKDQLPSIFFRFPGLVSSRARILRLQRYGLIALGSNSWLAKNDKVKNGSLILIHGNGNELHGIRKYNKLLHHQHTKIKNNQFNFFDIYDAIKLSKKVKSY